MKAAAELSDVVGTKAAAEALGLGRATVYRHRKPKQRSAPAAPRAPRTSHRALSPTERQEVLDELHSERFIDKAPATVWATLLDEDRYLASVRTMYRILDAAEEVRERRNQRRHPVYVKPELVAEGPNELWSWDITKLQGPVKWTYYHLYVVIDVYSRYVVGWMVASRETAGLAGRLLEDSYEKQEVEPGRLTVHADRGTSMKSKSVALLLADLGVSKTHSRPRVSNDNPYSEAQFKTLKYRPDFPARFGSLADARRFSQEFFRWYNTEHRHSGIALLTPEQVHYGQAKDVLAARQKVLSKAYEKNPERFVRRPPEVSGPPEAAWINRPTPNPEL